MVTCVGYKLRINFLQEFGKYYSGFKVQGFFFFGRNEMKRNIFKRLLKNKPLLVVL